MPTQRRSKRHPAYAQKLQEGIERNEAWAKLTTTEKLNSLALRRGLSKRQVSKLALAKELR